MGIINYDSSIHPEVSRWNVNIHIYKIDINALNKLIVIKGKTYTIVGMALGGAIALVTEDGARYRVSPSTVRAVYPEPMNKPTVVLESDVNCIVDTIVNEKPLCNTPVVPKPLLKKKPLHVPSEKELAILTGLKTAKNSVDLALVLLKHHVDVHLEPDWLIKNKNTHFGLVKAMLMSKVKSWKL